VTQGDAWTHDGFLGGRLKLWQPKEGYRAATDPVLLAAAVPAELGQSVLELGCGVGVASFCLMSRVVGVSVTGLEVQPDYAAAARRNGEETGLPLEVVEGDLMAMPQTLRARQFDHVMANPPWFEASSGTAPIGAGRAVAHVEGAAGIDAFIDAGLRRLAPGGRYLMIQRAERLADILSALGSKVGDVMILPIAARQGRAAKRVIVSARKGVGGPLKLCAPLILHEGERHLVDGDDYTRIARAILRDAQKLTLD